MVLVLSRTEGGQTEFHVRQIDYGKQTGTNLHAIFGKIQEVKHDRSRMRTDQIKEPFMPC